MSEHPDSHGGHDHVTYSVEPGSYDFVDKPDVVAVHSSMLKGTLESLPLVFQVSACIALFLVGTSFASVDFVAKFDHGPGGNVAEGNSGPPQPIPIIIQGKKFFTASCAACHQATGLGQAGNIPPLAGSDWVNGKPERLVAILSHGLQGSVKVNGAVYNAQMPAYPTLSDEKLAGLLSYIRSQWGNAAPAVSEDDIPKDKAQMPKPQAGAYTQEELEKIK